MCVVFVCYKISFFQPKVRKKNEIKSLTKISAITVLISISKLFSLYLCISLSLYLCISLSLCISVSLSLSLSLYPSSYLSPQWSFITDRTQSPRFIKSLGNWLKKSQVECSEFCATCICKPTAGTASSPNYVVPNTALQRGKETRIIGPAGFFFAVLSLNCPGWFIPETKCWFARSISRRAEHLHKRRGFEHCFR